MSEVSDRKSPERRLRFFRFALSGIVGLVFVMVTTLGWLASLGNLGSALLKGAIWTACAIVVSVIVYRIFKFFVEKTE